MSAERLSARALAVLQMLREAGEEGCRPADFAAVGCAEVEKHIDELTMAGYDVERDRISGDAYTYRLAYEPEAPSQSPSPPALPVDPPSTEPAPAQLFEIPPTNHHTDPEAA